MYKFEKLQKFPKLRHQFSTTKEGNMANVVLGKTKDSDEVLMNRMNFLKRTAFEIKNTVCMWVEHGNDIRIADRKSAGKSMIDKKFAVKCDGLLTDIKGLNLFLLIADCLPVILFDQRKEVLGLLHVGWRNADSNTTSHMIRKMTTGFTCDPKDIIIGFGPSARKGSYIFDEAVQKDDPKWRGFVTSVERKGYQIDIPGLCKKQFIDEGVSPQNIFDCGIDTISDHRFYSHYRDVKEGSEDQGRFACIVGME